MCGDEVSGQNFNLAYIFGHHPTFDILFSQNNAEYRGLSGDISPAYSTLSDEIIQRVVNYFPNLKVIFLARDPVERAWSPSCENACFLGTHIVIEPAR